MELHIEDVTHAVIEVLQHDEESRNDDKRLTFKVLARLLPGDDKRRKIELKMTQLRKLPAFATITRVRAFVQNELGKYLPTKAEVREKRRISEEAWHDWTTGTRNFPELQSQETSKSVE
jgi:hypothetical protein